MIKRHSVEVTEEFDELGKLKTRTTTTTEETDDNHYGGCPSIDPGFYQPTPTIHPTEVTC